MMELSSRDIKMASQPHRANQNTTPDFLLRLSDKGKIPSVASARDYELSFIWRWEWQRQKRGYKIVSIVGVKFYFCTLLRSYNIELCIRSTQVWLRGAFSSKWGKFWNYYLLWIHTKGCRKPSSYENYDRRTPLVAFKDVKQGRKCVSRDTRCTFPGCIGSRIVSCCYNL